MPDPASPADSIERFAELIALYDDGYTPRAAIVAVADVTPAAWLEIERVWMQRLAAGNDADLALRFGKTYGLTRLRFSNHALPDVTADSPEQAPGPSDGIQPPVDVDDTLRDMRPGGDAHPELDAPEPPTGQGAETSPDAGDPAGSSVEPLRPPMDPADSTLVCSPNAIPRASLPFVPPAVPPGKYLAYYDTRTGQRLPMPVLMDAAPSTES